MFTGAQLLTHLWKQPFLGLSSSDSTESVFVPFLAGFWVKLFLTLSHRISFFDLGPSVMPRMRLAPELCRFQESCFTGTYAKSPPPLASGFGIHQHQSLCLNPQDGTAISRKPLCRTAAVFVVPKNSMASTLCLMRVTQSSEHQTLFLALFGVAFPLPGGRTSTVGWPCEQHSHFGVGQPDPLPSPHFCSDDDRRLSSRKQLTVSRTAGKGGGHWAGA